jgi:hypothetical protein
MKNKYKIMGLTLFSALISNVAFAESVIYKMTDKNGKIVYTDRVPAGEKGAYAVLSPKSGVLKANVQKELSTTEVAVLEEKTKTEKNITEKNELQRRKDTALLSTYSNVSEIDKMKQFEMNQIDQSIKASVDSIANIKERLAQNEENSKNGGNKKTQADAQKLQTDLDVATKTLEYNKDLLTKRSVKYDEDKSRYEQILKDMSNAMPPKKTN